MKFDIPTSSHECASGANAIYGDAACCTEGIHSYIPSKLTLDRLGGGALSFFAPAVLIDTLLKCNFKIKEM